MLSYYALKNKNLMNSLVSVKINDNKIFIKRYLTNSGITLLEKEDNLREESKVAATFNEFSVTSLKNSKLKRMITYFMILQKKPTQY